MSRSKIFASSSNQSCAAELIIIILLCFLAFRLLASEEQSPVGGPISPLSAPTATFLPGTPSPVPSTATPIPLPGTPSFQCQLGIQVGKTANVVYHAVRVRYSPGYAAKDDAQDTKRYIKTGDQVTVIGGPEIRDGLCWWLVKHQEWQGWSADHSRQGRLLLSGGP